MSYTLDLGADLLPTPANQLPSSSRGITFQDVWRQRLIKYADADVNDTPAPVVVLDSAGNTVITDAVRKTRVGFRDFRKMHLMSQAFAYTQDEKYLAALAGFLEAWADINQPNGHPINQTHLIQMHLAYQSQKAFLSSALRSKVDAWIGRLITSCINWPFDPEPGGANVSLGNHYTHHLAQFLHCYISLEDSVGIAAVKALAVAHLNNSFPFGNASITYPASPEDFTPSAYDMPRAATSAGESIDFIRRDSFKYQAYNLEPWFEIAIETGVQFEAKLLAGYQFLRSAFVDYPLHYEFANSSDDFDALRYAGSRSEYLQPNSMFKPDIACRAILQYHTWRKSLNAAEAPDSMTLNLAMHSDQMPSNWNFAFRYVLGV